MIPIVIWIAVLFFTLFTFVIYKEALSMKLQDGFNDSMKVNTTAGRQSLLSLFNRWDTITNTSLDQVGSYTTDQKRVTWWSVSNSRTDAFGVIDDITSLDSNFDPNTNTVILDQIVTNRMPSVSRYGWDGEPDKQNNVFEIDLVDFINDYGQFQRKITNVNDLKIYWGTAPENTPSLYVIMARVEKNATINVNEDYNVNTAKRLYGLEGFWVTDPRHTPSGPDIDKMWVNYIKLDGTINGTTGATTWSCSNQNEDPDILIKNTWQWFSWCKSYNLTDILKWTTDRSIDLEKYNYKVFLVFGQTKYDDQSVPFKIVSEETGKFWVGNLVQGDITLVTWGNTKSRVVIQKSTKNNVMPYLIWNLWTRWRIVLDEDKS